MTPGDGAARPGLPAVPDPDDDPIGPIARPRPARLGTGCLIFTGAAVAIPYLLSVLLDALSPYLTDDGAIAVVLAILGGLAAPLYMTSAWRRARRQRRQLGRRADAVSKLTADDDHIEITLPPDRVSAAPPDHPRWQTDRARLVGLRDRHDAALIGEPPVMRLPLERLPPAGDAFAQAMDDARAVAAWLAGFDDPRAAWLTAIALDDTARPIRAAEALRTLLMPDPDRPLARRVRAATLDRTEPAFRLAAACAVGDRAAARTVRDDRGAVARFEQLQLTQLIDTLYRANPDPDRRGELDALVAHPEPAVRLALCLERDRILPDPIVMRLAHDACRVVRGAAWSIAVGRSRATTLEAARGIVRTRGDAPTRHPYVLRWRSAADAEDPSKVPRHLRGPLSRLVPRALSHLGAHGLASDIPIVSLRIDEAMYSRAARVARNRLERRFGDNPAGGELALMDTDDSQGFLSPADGDGRLSPAPDAGPDRGDA